MITRKGLFLILIVTLVGFALVRWAQVAGPAPRQIARLSQAQVHADKYQAQIKSEQRFKYVELSTYTGEGGCFCVQGAVGSSNDLVDLKRQIEATKPPVPTKWFVRVMEIK